MHGPVIVPRAPLKTAKRGETAASRTKVASPNEASPLTNLQSALPPMPAPTWTPNEMPEGWAGSEYLSSVLSLSRGYRRLHDPELFNFRHRYRGILFNSLDSINYTGVRLQQSPFPLSFSPSPLPLTQSLSSLHVVLLNNPVLIPRPRPRVVSRDTRVYQGKPLNVPMPVEVKVAGHVTRRVVIRWILENVANGVGRISCMVQNTPTCNRKIKVR